MGTYNWLSSANKSFQEVFWMESPDYRLGQFSIVAKKPTTTTSEIVFNVGV